MWDGRGCIAPPNNYGNLNNTPWFHRELREEIGLQSIEIYAE